MKNPLFALLDHSIFTTAYQDNNGNLACLENENWLLYLDCAQKAGGNVKCYKQYMISLLYNHNPHIELCKLRNHLRTSEMYSIVLAIGGNCNGEGEGRVDKCTHISRVRNGIKITLITNGT